MNACIIGRSLTGLIVDFETHPEYGTATRILHASATSCNYFHGRNLSESKNGVTDEKAERPANGSTCARHEDRYSLIDRWASEGPLNKFWIYVDQQRLPLTDRLTLLAEEEAGFMMNGAPQYEVPSLCYHSHPSYLIRGISVLAGTGCVGRTM